MKSIILTSLVVLGLAIAPRAVQAQATANPPGQISYQGYLTDANGFPLATNNPVNYNVQFKIFNASTGGSNMWGELQVVTVDRGYFTVMLGNGSALPGVPSTNNLAGIFSGLDASDRYLELTVQGLAAGDPPIAPRLRLLASPYSYLSSRALTAAAVDAATVVPDVNLSTNVALKNATQSFTGVNTFSNVVKISGNNVLELGAGVPNKQFDAGRIGYGTYTAGALDIVGAGTNVSGADRKIKFWNEGGATFAGPISAPGLPSLGANSFSGAQTIGSSFYPTTFDFYGRMNLWSPFGPYYGTGITLNDCKEYNTANTATFGWALNNFEWSQDASQHDATLRCTGGKLLLQSGTGSSAICITTGNYVGIGTTAPGAPLQVNGYNTITAQGTYFLSGTGLVNANAQHGRSIISQGCIQASEFFAISDQRIKDVVSRADAREDLATIQQLKVTDYRLKDRVVDGGKLHKGLIAQEVQAVIPEAVDQSSEFIPNIYVTAEKLTFDKSSHTLRVALGKAHDLKRGDKVRLIMDEKTVEQEVVAVPDDRSFVVGSFSQEPKRLFVYGKQVADFLSVDYDRIFTTGISAIQELAKQMAEQKKQLNAKDAQIADLEQRLLKLEQAVETSKTRNTASKSHHQMASTNP